MESLRRVSSEKGGMTPDARRCVDSRHLSLEDTAGVYYVPYLTERNVRTKSPLPVRYTGCVYGVSHREGLGMHRGRCSS
jgi:hypothetical protein